MVAKTKRKVPVNVTRGVVLIQEIDANNKIGKPKRAIITAVTPVKKQARRK